MSNDKVLYNLGVDLNSSFTFHDGDITLSTYDDNLVQAICNRLNTRLNELFLFYNDGYGSVFRDFLGWHGNDDTIGFMQGELKTVLLNERRVSDFDFSISYTNGKVRIDLNLTPNDGYVISATFELSENGFEVLEDVV